jgi:hypothetical protein
MKYLSNNGESMSEQPSQPVLEKLNLNLDVILSCALILLGTVLFGIGLAPDRFQMEQAGLILVLAPAVYLLYRKRLNSVSAAIETAVFPLDAGLVKRLHILVFALFTVSICIINRHVYVRPLSFLVVTAAISGIIAAIVCGSVKEVTDYLTLAEIFGLGLLLRASLFYQFPTLYASDPVLHAGWIENLAVLGHVAAFMQGYQSFPLMHIFSVMVMDLTSLLVKDTLFITGVGDIISLFFIFLIIRQFFNDKVGMLALLLLMVSTWHIAYDFLDIPQTSTIALLNILIYLLFCKKEAGFKKDFFCRAMAIAILIAIVLTHTIGSFAALIILVSIWLAVQVLNYIRNPKQNDSQVPYIPFSLIIFMLIFQMSYWMYSAGFFMFVTDSVKWAFKVTELSPPVTTLAESFQAIGLRWLPSYLSIFVALIGSFYLLRNRRNSIYFTMYGWGVIMFVFLSTFFNWYSFLPGRWFAFIEAVLVVPLVIALNCIAAICRNRALAMSLIVFVFSFMMTTNYNANITNLIPLTPQPTQSLKASEVVAAGTLKAELPDKAILYSDNVFGELAGTTDGSQILLGKSQLDSILVLRQAIEGNACYVTGGSDHYDTVIMNYKPDPDDRQVYDCGTLEAIER